jgi:hypothetical protein
MEQGSHYGVALTVDILQLTDWLKPQVFLHAV